MTTNRVYDCGSEKANRVDYGVKITTSDIIFAGTEDDIFIDIIGTKGCTHRQPLDGEYFGSLERGKTVKFTVNSVDLGEVRAVTLFKVGRDDWLVNSVTIEQGY